MGIVGVGIVFVLLTGILPLYETIPSINDFILSQKTKIINEWSNNEWIITIKNALWNKMIPLNTLDQKDIDLSQKTQISYASKIQGDTEKIFIDIWNGSFIHISPQSAITLEQSWNNTIMEIIQWNIEYYTPSEFSWALQLIGKYTGKKIQDIQNNIRSDIVGQFEQKKEDFFMNQIGGSIILNPAINKVINFFITTLYKINPKVYEKNLINYSTMQNYFGITTTGNTSSTITGENIKSIINDIMSQVKKWTEETTIINQILHK